MSGTQGFIQIDPSEYLDDTNSWHIEQTLNKSDTITDDIYHIGRVGIGDFTSSSVTGRFHVKNDGDNLLVLEGVATGVSPEIVFINPDNTANGNTVTLTNRDGVVLTVEDGNTSVWTIEDNYQMFFHEYGDGDFTSGTPTYNLSVTNSGAIVERPYRLPNPGDPIISSGGTGGTLNQTLILDRWSTDYMYSYRIRCYITMTSGVGWFYLAIPTKAGFQQPKIGAIGTYRNTSNAPQRDANPPGNGLDGAGPHGPFMGSEMHHWSSTNRIYQGYYRRDNGYSMYVEFTVDYIQT